MKGTPEDVLFEANLVLIVKMQQQFSHRRRMSHDSSFKSQAITRVYQRKATLFKE